jgi:carboxyl-terminal processing protease
MKSKALLYVFGGIFVLLLLAGTCSAGFLVGRTTAAGTQSVSEVIPTLHENQLVISTPAAAQEATPEDLQELFKPFWQAWGIVNDQYVDQPVNQVTLMRGAITGMLESLGDQHTSYMDPDQFRQANIPMDGEYEGIGAWVDPTGEYLVIISPMPGSPAEQAGLQPGDVIIAVDGEDMTGVDGNLIIRKVLGPAGSVVNLTIHREGQAEPFDVDVKRARITIPSVESEILDDDIAYIQLINFGDRATEELRNAIKDVLKQKPAGLILDLRNNGGGYLTSAVEVASEFISDGVILYEEYGDGSRDTYKALRGGLATDIPLVVLINEGSASASEIVAGAIQDHERGILVGTTSFGKGSVQNWIPLDDQQGAVRVTMARWLTPNERTIHLVGLEPDFVVEITEEDIAADRDPQLDKAIELLTK